MRFCIECGKFAQGTRCQACAIIKSAERNARRPQYKDGWASVSKKLRDEQPWCSICGLPEKLNDPLQVDHIVPVAQGGTNDESNLQVVHRSYNAAKKDK